MVERGDETIRIDAGSRWDALELLRRLRPFRTHLVQLNDRRWLVCVRPDRELDELEIAVLRTASAWAADRHVTATVSVADRSYAVRP